MTFIDQPKDDSEENKKIKAANSISLASPQKEDYDKQVKSIGLTGGQSADSKGGLDISKYTGPKSKPSSLFKDPEAKFKTGPGNGLSSEENQDQESEKDIPGDPNEHV